MLPLSGKSIVLVAAIALGVQLAREKYMGGGAISKVIPVRRAAG